MRTPAWPRPVLYGGALAGLLLAPALALADDNVVALGQTGDTNVIGVTQVGSGNLAGANQAGLLLNQNGKNNDIEIVQTGTANDAGAVLSTVADDPSGIDQFGDRNRLSITQTNHAGTDHNHVGAVSQAAVTGGATTANDLTIVQSDPDDAPGAGGHRIGTVIQQNTVLDSDPNTALLTQVGGGDSLGDVIEFIRQVGWADAITVLQNQHSNHVGSAAQNGDHETFDFSQLNGSGNSIATSTQFGSLSTATVQQSGNSNYVAQILQDNAGLAIRGDTAILMIAGDDNGSDGLGGPGAFTGRAALISVYEASVMQTGGDGNDLRYTISFGTDNQYGFAQTGDGNGIVGVVRGQGNQDAMVQIGDDNNLHFTVDGKGNSAGAELDGDRNYLTIAQANTTDDGNDVLVHVRGNSNNLPLLGGFTGDALLAAGTALTPGLLTQDGEGNVIDVNVNVTADANLFAIGQAGNANVASIAILSGSGNQSAIRQTGSDNAAGTRQSGMGNNISIIQL